MVHDLAARHHAEMLKPSDAEHGPEQSLCARAKCALESTGATMIICDLPIEVSVRQLGGAEGGVRDT